MARSECFSFADLAWIKYLGCMHPNAGGFKLVHIYNPLLSLSLSSPLAGGRHNSKHSIFPPILGEIASQSSLICLKHSKNEPFFLRHAIF